MKAKKTKQPPINFIEYGGRGCYVPTRKDLLHG